VKPTEILAERSQDTAGLLIRPFEVSTPVRAELVEAQVSRATLRQAQGERLILHRAESIVLRAGDPVITYVARNLEPYRGFHQFMRALEIVQREHPTVQTVVVGGDDVSYGKRPAQSRSKNDSQNAPQNNAPAKNWREHILQACRIDPTRTHFLGRIPYEQYKKILQVSAAHVYLTVPFVLSWSLLEAMASGCLVIASNTAPVREVIQDGVNGLLVDFFNPQDIARQILHSLQEPRLSIPLRQAAQAHVRQHYGLRAGIHAYEKLLHPSFGRTQQNGGATP
jgi:glycosyltransferase involved in cell wall biosynthesis